MEVEKLGRPAVAVITEGFIQAAVSRAKVLGMPDQPRVVLEHPIASKTKAEMTSMAERFVDAIVGALVTPK